MSRKLELVREEKLHRLLPGKSKDSRLEASGVALLDDTTVLVVFDNLNQVARVDISLEPRRSNRLMLAPSVGTGFEEIAIDRETGRVFCLIEALEDVDGLYRGFVVEYDTDCRFVRMTRLSTRFESENKGYEGLAHIRRGGREYLLALCEGNVRTGAGRNGGRMDALVPVPEGGWKTSHRIRLPKNAEFDDYAAVDYMDGRLAVVSQSSARLWVARIDEDARRVVPGSETVYRFPKRSYRNVEGIAWLSDDTLIAVSDRRKSSQPARCARKDQSIHVFRIPAAGRGSEGEK